jgi:hypothetical protein
MSDYDALLNSLLNRNEFSLLEWAKRGWLKDVKRLTPYFIAYLHYPFDTKEKGSKEYEEEKTKCYLLYKKLDLNAIGNADRGFFDCEKWPFYFSECPELLLMSEDDREEYRKGLCFPEIRTYLYTREAFRRLMQDMEAEMEVISKNSLIWKWLDDSDIAQADQAQKVTSTNGEIQNSVYRLILGMAIDGFGFDPIAPKQGNGVMKSISAALERQGLGSIESETILKHLRNAVKETGWKPHKS